MSVAYWKSICNNAATLKANPNCRAWCIQNRGQCGDAEAAMCAADPFNPFCSHFYKTYHATGAEITFKRNYCKNPANSEHPKCKELCSKLAHLDMCPDPVVVTKPEPVTKPEVIPVTKPEGGSTALFILILLLVVLALIVGIVAFVMKKGPFSGKNVD
jgi:hypothetical protein